MAPSTTLQDDVEVLTLDDDTMELANRKRRTVRKSTGVGGKAPHLAVPFRQVRKAPLGARVEGRRKEVPEYFDVEDEEEEDDIQVVEKDPLDDVEVEDRSAGFCDVCGDFLGEEEQVVEHRSKVHGLVRCRWCQVQVQTAHLARHLTSSCSSFSRLLGSHCSRHGVIETEEMARQEEYRDCRPYRCSTCGQQFDLTSLRDWQAAPQAYLCPGCLHGHVPAPPPEGKAEKKDAAAEEEGKAETKDVTPKEPRKVARKSTRPPRAPQKDAGEIIIDEEASVVLKENKVSETFKAKEISMLAKEKEVTSNKKAPGTIYKKDLVVTKHKEGSEITIDEDVSEIAIESAKKNPEVTTNDEVSEILVDQNSSEIADKKPATNEKNVPEDIIDQKEATEDVVDKKEVPEVKIDEKEIPEVTLDKKEVPEVTIDKKKVPEVTTDKKEVPEISIEKKEVLEVTIEDEEFSLITIDEREASEIIIDEKGTSETTSAKKDTSEITIEEEEASEITIDDNEASEITIDEKEIASDEKEVSEIANNENKEGRIDVPETSMKTKVVEQVSEIFDKNSSNIPLRRVARKSTRPPTDPQKDSNKFLDDEMIVEEVSNEKKELDDKQALDGKSTEDKEEIDITDFLEVTIEDESNMEQLSKPFEEDKNTEEKEIKTMVIENKSENRSEEVITLEDDTSVSENGKNIETEYLEEQKKVEEINLEEKEVITLEDDQSVPEIGKVVEIVNLEDQKKVEEINLEDEKEQNEIDSSKDKQKPEIRTKTTIILEDHEQDKENCVRDKKKFEEITLEDEAEIKEVVLVVESKLITLEDDEIVMDCDKKTTADALIVNEEESEPNKLCDESQKETVKDSDFMDEETTDQIMAESKVASKPPATGGLLFASWMISGDGDKDVEQTETANEKKTRKRKLVLPSSMAAKVARVEEEEEEEVLLLASPTRSSGCSLEEISS